MKTNCLKKEKQNIMQITIGEFVANKNNQRAIRELSLLIPSYSYIKDSIKKADKEEKKDNDYKMATSIASRMKLVIKNFTKGAHYKALKISDRAMRDANIEFIKKYPQPPEKLDQYGGIKLNVLALALGLFGVHHELKNRVINIGFLNELVELQDFCEKYIPNEDIINAYRYSDYVLQQTFSEKEKR